jgi:hypothetical protein
MPRSERWVSSNQKSKQHIPGPSAYTVPELSSAACSALIKPPTASKTPEDRSNPTTWYELHRVQTAQEVRAKWIRLPPTRESDPFDRVEWI